MLWTFYVIPHKFDWKRKREKKLKKGEREEEKLFSHLRDESGENVFRGKKFIITCVWGCNVWICMRKFMIQHEKYPFSGGIIELTWRAA
jgi:hypothetical protein